jgi:hypothetical protein
MAVPDIGVMVSGLKLLISPNFSQPLIRMKSGSKPDKPVRPVTFENRWMIRPCWILFTGLLAAVYLNVAKVGGLQSPGVKGEVVAFFTSNP